MTLDPSTLIELARLGASVRIDGDALASYDLDRLVVEARESGSRVTICNVQAMDSNYLCALATIGCGSVEFDATRGSIRPDASALPRGS